MDAMVLPRNADYRSVLPLEAHSHAKRRNYFPVNGQSFTSTGNNIIRIDISGDAFLDPKLSYLSFRLTNRTGQALGVDFGGGHTFIRRLRIEQSGNILTDCNNYNRLLSACLLPTYGGVDSVKHRSVSENCRYANDKGVGALATTSLINGDVSGATVSTPITGSSQLAVVGGGAAPAAGSQATFCIPLMNGLLGPNQSKMIPLQLLGSSPLTIEIELANVLDIGCWAVAPAAGVDYEIDQVRYIAQLVEVPPQITQQVRMVQDMADGRIVLSGSDYTHFNANIGADATGMQSLNVPARRRSIKSIWWVGASQAFVAGGAAAQDARYNLSYGGHMNMLDYSIKIGSIQHPPTPIQCNYNTAAGSKNFRAEHLYELEKTLGVASSVGGCGSLASFNFATADCNVANMPARAAAATGALDTSFQFCPFSLDMESFQRVSADGGAVNTADRATPITLQLNIGDNAAAQEAINIDAFVCYNSLFFINADGSIRVSF
tara:strand:+ start:3265 stop:4737 length:1473 start_codon:yes stop_codon:yes gene_type:complete